MINISNDISKFVGAADDKGNKIMRLRPEQEKKRLEKVILELSKGIRKSFDNKMDELENNLLG